MNHPFLNFSNHKAKERHCRERIESLWQRREQIGEPRRLCWDLMERINQSERLNEMLSDPMVRLLEIKRSIYLELTLEFFASYSFEKPRSVSNPDFYNAKRIQFRLGGKWHKWSVARFGLELGIYTDEDLNTELFDSMYKFEGTQQKLDFWGDIAVGPAYEARSAKASRLRDPLLRVLHQVFSHTIAGRMDSSGNCPTPDLLFLFSIVTGTPINLAVRMAEFLSNSAGRTVNSQIHGGEYVTQLAYATGVMTDDVMQSLTHVSAGIEVDLRSLRAMNLIVDTANGPRLRGLNGEIWDPLAPQLGDAEMPDAGHFLGNIQHQQHQEQQQHHEHQQYQYQDWPRDIPSYPEFYRQFQQMQVTQNTMREEMHAGFSYIFGGLQSAHPTYFGDPPQFPFGAQGDNQGARRYDAPGSSGTRHNEEEENDDDQE